MFCRQCGQEILAQAAVCVHCGVATGLTPMIGVSGSKSRLAYILLGLFLGCLGVHNFYAGYAGRGISQLLITIFTGWLILPLLIVTVWVIVEICSVTRDARGVPFT